MLFSDETGEIFKALSKFRGKVVQPEKTAKNPFFKSNYVTLEGVIKAIDNGTKETGLSWFQEAKSQDKTVSVSTIIIHESGQYIRFDPFTVIAVKSDPQAVGSALTYAKRYALAATFGISSDIDDDGCKASEQRPSYNNKPVAKKPVPKPKQNVGDVVMSNERQIKLNQNLTVFAMKIQEATGQPSREAYKEFWTTTNLTENKVTENEGKKILRLAHDQLESVTQE